LRVAHFRTLKFNTYNQYNILANVANLLSMQISRYFQKGTLNKAAIIEKIIKHIENI